MASTITIEGKNFGDEKVREAALNKLNTLTTEELDKVSQLCTPKGRNTLKTKWFLIKNYIKNDTRFK